jgi:hypothetical protein
MIRALNQQFWIAAAAFAAVVTWEWQVMGQDNLRADTLRVASTTVPRIGERLTDDQLAALARLALRGIDTEYPNKPSNVMVGPEGVLSPRQLHPAFFGCYDWHSSVHGHWMLVRLLRLYPECSIGPEIRQALDRHLTPENIETEANYFLAKENKSFERMYGWAWALQLAAELAASSDGDAARWRQNLRPLELVLCDQLQSYLPKLEFPIRTGVHPDTGFALGLALDYARQVDDSELERLILQRCKDYYLGDCKYPFGYEPSGEDFFSSGLNEADLMRRVLEPDEFGDWLNSYWPSLRDGATDAIPPPVVVSDVTDPKLVHLAGLNLSRAWCLDGIARSLPEGDARRTVLAKAADEHTTAGARYVFSGYYEGEHWLATFAVYLVTESGR